MIDLGLSLTSLALKGRTAAPTWPMRGEDGAAAALDLDFERDRYLVGGVEIARADLTTLQGTPTWEAEGVLIDGTDRLQVPAASIPNWFDWGKGTLLVEWYRTNNAADGTVFSMLGGSGSAAVRLEADILADRRCRLSLIDGALGNPAGYYVLAPFQPSTYPRTNRGRAALAWETGAVTQTAERGYLGTGTVTVQALAGLFPTAAAIGYRRLDSGQYFNGHIKRIVYWPAKYSSGWLQSVTSHKKSLHLLGDSFVTTTYFQTIAAHMLDDDRAFSHDGVGGSTLTQQAARFAASSQYHDRTLVIMDGGLDTDAATSIAAITDMAGRLSHGRWLYVEPSPGALVTGSPDRIAWDAKVAAIRAHVGEDRFVETLSRALTQGDGGANDNADIANGIWPRSLRADSIHPTTAGFGAVQAYQIAAKLAANGW